MYMHALQTIRPSFYSPNNLNECIMLQTADMSRAVKLEAWLDWKGLTSSYNTRSKNQLTAVHQRTLGRWEPTGEMKEESDTDFIYERHPSELRPEATHWRCWFELSHTTGPIVSAASNQVQQVSTKRPHTSLTYRWTWELWELGDGFFCSASADSEAHFCPSVTTTLSHCFHFINRFISSDLWLRYICVRWYIVVPTFLKQAATLRSKADVGFSGRSAEPAEGRLETFWSSAALGL